jgi:hypothetical protein
MTGSSTFGIEQEDGSVVYNIYAEGVFHKSILYEYMKGRTVEIIEEDSYHATSIEDYYNEARFEEEDSKVRGILLLNGTIEYRYWGDKGFFTYTIK